jgi:hypothetical protein
MGYTRRLGEVNREVVKFVHIFYKITLARPTYLKDEHIEVYQ